MEAETSDFEIPIVMHGGYPHWRWPDGRLRPVIQGGAADDDADGDEEDEDFDDEDEDEDDDDDAKSKRGKKKEATFTQRQMNAIATREKRDGRKAGRNEVLKELGFDSLEDAKAALAGKKAASDKQDKDDSKADSEAAKLRREAEEAKAEAAKIKFESKLERKLLAADANPRKVDRMVRLLDLDTDASDDEIEEAIDDLAEELPALFLSEGSDDDDEDDEDDRPRNRRRGTDTTPRKRKLPDSDTGRRQRKVKAAPPKELARKRLAERHPKLVSQNK